MKKKIAILSIILFGLSFSSISAAVYSTSNTGSSQGYTITARANWEYTTGEYTGKGSHTIDKKPSNTLFTVYSAEYLNTHESSKYSVTQYFRPVYYNTWGQITSYGSSFGINVKSNGPY